MCCVNVNLALEINRCSHSPRNIYRSQSKKDRDRAETRRRKTTLLREYKNMKKRQRSRTPGPQPSLCEYVTTADGKPITKPKDGENDEPNNGKNQPEHIC